MNAIQSAKIPDKEKLAMLHEFLTKNAEIELNTHKKAIERLTKRQNSVDSNVNLN